MSAETLQNVVVGIIIGALVTAFGWFLQIVSTSRKEKKLNEELHRKKRRQAYSQLKAILDGLRNVGDSTTKKRVYSEQLKELESIVAENQDVLDDSTLEAWYSKKVSDIETTEQHAEHCVVEFGVFVGDVRYHYERFDRRNPNHSFAYVLNSKQ